MATINRIYGHGNCFVVYRNNVQMAAFHMEWMADLFCTALVQRYVDMRYGTVEQACAELEIRGEYHETLRF